MYYTKYYVGSFITIFLPKGSQTQNLLLLVCTVLTHFCLYEVY